MYVCRFGGELGLSGERGGGGGQTLSWRLIQFRISVAKLVEGVEAFAFRHSIPHVKDTNTVMYYVLPHGYGCNLYTTSRGYIYLRRTSLQFHESVNCDTRRECIVGGWLGGS